MTQSNQNLPTSNKRKFIFGSLGLYVLSGFVPIFIGSDYPGVAGLLLGWMALLEFELTIALPWLANIFYFANLLLWKLNIRTKIIISILTIFLGLFAIGIKEVLVDEGGNKEQVTVGLGYALWMLSFLILLSGQYRTLRVETMGERQS